MRWILFASVAAISLAAADVFIKSASGKISNGLALLIYGSCTFLMGLGWLLWQRNHGVATYAQPSGLLAALGVGISFGLVTAALYLTFGAGAPISIASPLVRLGGLLVASIAGIFFWHEPFTLRYGIGVLLASTGVYLIITR